MYGIAMKLLIVHTILPKICVASSPTEKLKNTEKFNLTQPKTILSLRVSSTHYEPFMYQNEVGTFYSGIEYKLLKIIARMEDLDLIFQNASSPSSYDHLMFK